LLSACSSDSGGGTVATSPDAPTIGAATAGDASADIAFRAPASNGGAAITGYEATCVAGADSISATGTGSPVTVTGLTNDTTYDCSVSATNSVGTSSASSPVSVTPSVTSGTPGMIDTDSYILAVDPFTDGVYLVNHDGDTLFEWLLDLELGNDANLLDDGSLVTSLKTDNPQISFGGFGGIFRKTNVDQSTDWEITYSTDDYIAHHDVEYLSNGNIIFLVWERVTASDAAEMGFIENIDIYPDAVVEMNPLTQEVVWEWHVTDHIIQDFDSSKENYGVVADNPNRIDINYNSGQSDGDITHANGLTLDETRDLLYITVNFYGEVWVIDHSTTTAEAASNSGGNSNYNLGGDLVYRFGNPLAYDNVGNVTLGRVHYPNLLVTGNMLVFANDVYGTQSAVVEYELSPPYLLMAGQDNEPAIVWEFTHPDLFSINVGSGVRMSNGNTLIAEGTGTLWEVSDSGEVLWQTTDFARPWRAYAFPYYSPAVIALGL